MTKGDSLKHRVSNVVALAPAVSEAEARTLVGLAADYNVRWEVWPERQSYRGDAVHQIGFEVDLLGDHFEPRHPPSPGCDECRKVHAALRTIVEFVLPSEGRASRYDVSPYEPSLRFPNDPHTPGYVTLKLRILHRNDYGAPPDECERRCLDEIESRLSAIGARPGKRHLGEG